jgi:uncharacterized protein YbaR (Trm112 family)/ubiquinone/menaquinone biosynthesis C-methylase UbiE
MQERLLGVLRCPECDASLELDADARGDVESGVLTCRGDGHVFPIVGGIPRLLPATADTRTRDSFDQEWELQDLGGPTWGMEVDERVRVFFLDALRIPEDELGGKVVLDAGCGNGAQSVAYTALGLEVIAIDISRGVEQGQAYRGMHAGARGDRVHFIQGDLRRPGLAPASVDVIHSVGALHHTPGTRATFRALRPLLRDGGTFYVWLYRHEPYVTPVIDAIRTVTTRVPPPVLARAATALARPALAVRAATTALKVRGYPPATPAEAAHGLIDTFGAPYRRHHSFDEIAGWFRDEGFTSVWRCNEGRRGLGVCGRLPAAD